MTTAHGLHLPASPPPQYRSVPPSASVPAATPVRTDRLAAPARKAVYDTAYRPPPMYTPVPDAALAPARLYANTSPPTVLLLPAPSRAWMMKVAGTPATARVRPAPDADEKG